MVLSFVLTYPLSTLQTRAMLGEQGVCNDAGRRVPVECHEELGRRPRLEGVAPQESYSCRAGAQARLRPCIRPCWS